ncbi:MAG: FAD-dependent monooxygenase [Pseudomonadota bacterium]
MTETEIFIGGGGIAGLSAAARLGADGRRVMLADPAPAVLSDRGDLRTTAYLQPAVETLTRAGAWTAMQSHGAELRTMRIVDAGGVERAPRETVDFRGDETGFGAFGWNVPNAPARTALLETLASMPNVELWHERRVTGFLARDREALVRLDNGAQIRAKLVVAADGRDSTLRENAGLRAPRWAYGQKALVFAVTHGRPHDGVSTEIHRTGGPLTLVPMPDLESKPCSSVVWMVPGARAAELSRMDDGQLGAELTAETMGLFGALTLAGPRAVWPIISQMAMRLVSDRLALVAEAAHVMPPIGAQGLNTSLHDIETLAKLTEGADDPGARDLLARYERRILPRTLTRVGGVDILNRAAMAEFQPLRDLRRVGLNAISRFPPLRRFAIRTGLGS